MKPLMQGPLLEGRVALITGGARGNGAGMARLFAEHGARLALVDLDGDEAAEEAASIQRETGVAALGLPCDVSVETQARRVVDRTVSEYGRLDVLVNNAGVFNLMPFLEMDDAEWGRHHRVNLDGPMYMARAVGRQMASQRAGAIINLSSIAAETVFAGASAYSTSKAALEALTRVLAFEFAPLGVRVNAVAPGIILTAMTASLYSTDAAVADMEARIPAGRIGSPRDVAGAALFLASDLAGYVTGQTLVVDGGFTLSS